MYTIMNYDTPCCSCIILPLCSYFSQSVVGVGALYVASVPCRGKRRMSMSYG